ncbi:MAG: hypothetical protein A2V93_03460 [Ignavibacteria bacterium RBG_16_34_14]|nr:MAG: hypothetical protein A2V93_03460 [Ignavibacteria bacterium RBG_16_34_14]
MKFIKIILVLIITCSVYPCTENISFTKIEIISLSSEKSEIPEDNCCEFCFCACCSNSFSVEKIISFSNYFISAENPVIKQNKYLINHFAQIWQPPKIS